jgi:hypothetical protein
MFCYKQSLELRFNGSTSESIHHCVSTESSLSVLHCLVPACGLQHISLSAVAILVR